MPALYTVYNQDMTERINEYYGNATIFKNNMFFVGLWGQYVQEAISTMKSSAKKDPANGRDRRGYTKGVYVYQDALDRWLNVYNRKDTPDEVELKWTCKNIKIPTVESNFAEGNQYSIDAIKPLSYPLISDYGGSKTVTLTIVDDRNMMMWHFFNTLHNMFYSAQILKPRSSFHKVGMYCAVIQGDNLPTDKVSPTERSKGATLETGGTRKQIISDVPAMVYEFNSAVITNVGGIEFKQDSPGMFTFTVSIQVPNTFQGTFKTFFRGLRNNTSDSTGFDSGSIIDVNGIGTGGYNNLDYTSYNSASVFEDANIDGNGSGGGSGLDFKRNPDGSISNPQGSRSSANTRTNPSALNNIQGKTQ